MASYQRVFQTGKPSSWESVFCVDFAFILWWLSTFSPGMHCMGVSFVAVGAQMIKGVCIQRSQLFLQVSCF